MGKESERLMKGTEPVSVRPESPHHFHATTEADTQYFLEQAAKRISRCRENVIPVLESGQRYIETVSQLHQNGYVISEIKDVYGSDSIIRCYTKGGDVILADTTGIHLGEKPANKNRSILSVNYCIHPEYGFEHPPVLVKKKNRDIISPFGQLAAEHLVEVACV